MPRDLVEASYDTLRAAMNLICPVCGASTVGCTVRDVTLPDYCGELTVVVAAGCTELSMPEGWSCSIRSCWSQLRRRSGPGSRCEPTPIFLFVGGA